MTDTNQNILVKLLTGLQSGAELVLPAGEYILGSDESSDLVLIDAAVHPRHAQLTVSSQEISITPLAEAPVTVGGKIITGSTVLHNYDVLGLGGVFLAIGPDTPWPELPPIPEPQKANISSPDNQPSPSGEPQTSRSPDGETGTEEDTDAAVDTKDTADNEAKAVKPPTQDRRRLLAMVLALALLSGLLGGGVLAYRAIFTRSPGEVLASNLVDRGVSVLYPAPSDAGILAMNQIGLVEDNAGGFILRGLVPDAEAVRKIQSDPSFAGIAVRDELKLADAETRTVEKVLKASYPWAELKPTANGFYAILSGLAPKTDDANKAYRLARTELDSRIGIRRAITDWADLRRNVEAYADRLDVRKPRFTLKDGAVTFSATPWPSPEQREDLTSYIDADYGHSIAALFEEALAKEPPKPKPAPVLRQPPLPDPAYLAALKPLPVITPPQKPVPQPEPEEQTPEPELAQQPVQYEEPVPVQPQPQPMQAAEKSWRIQSITPGGFVDQFGRRHKSGDYLSSNLRVVNSWEQGVVFQRGTETLFGGVGTEIIDSAPKISAKNTDQDDELR